MQRRFDIVQQGVDVAGAYRQLGAGAGYAGPDFLSRVLLASTVLLDHDQGGLYALIGGEALTALQAFTAASDTVIRLARVGDLRIVVAAVGAFHPVGWSLER